MQANDTGAKPKRDRAPFLSLISAIVRQRFRTAPALPEGSGPATGTPKRGTPKRDLAFTFGSTHLEFARKSATEMLAFSTVTIQINHLASTVPSLAIKTGASVRSSKLEKMGSEPMSLAMLLDRTNSGTPVLCLDVRRRPDIRELACKEVGKLSVSKAGILEVSCRNWASAVLRKAAVVPQETTARKHASLDRSTSETQLVKETFVEVMTDAETKHRC